MARGPPRRPSRRHQESGRRVPASESSFAQEVIEKEPETTRPMKVVRAACRRRPCYDRAPMSGRASAGRALLGAVLFLSSSLPVSPLAAQMSPLRYPPTQGGQIRVEGYLVPAVTSWPAYPDFTADGRDIVFAMEGRIWTVPRSGGIARELSQGPGYDFEPAVSPDGSTIAFSRDVDGNIDIYSMPLAGGDAKRLSRDPALEFHPRWTRNGQILFASAVDGQFDIGMIDPSSGAVAHVETDPANDIQPDASHQHDQRFVFVSSRSDVVGTGGIWLSLGERQREIVREETSFRTRPTLSPDGHWLAYVSNLAGTNDLWLYPIDRRRADPFRLSLDSAFDELMPAFSPDSKTLVFVSNRGGSFGLRTMDIHGGPVTTVPIEGREYRRPTGVLRLALAQPSRVTIQGSDRRYYAPAESFRRVVGFTETHYFHASGPLEIALPLGPARVDVLRGPEFRPETRTVDITPGENELRVRLERALDWGSRGYVSGDTHVHDLHAGDIRLSTEALVAQAAAEDLRIINSLIHMDGSKLMGDIERFLPAVHPASNEEVILRYGQEYRTPFGHRTFLNTEAMVYPLVSGLDGTAYASLYPPLYEYIRQFREGQANILVGIPHPYFGDLARGEIPDRGMPAEIPVDVALGLVDYFDVNCIPSDERGSAAIYARLLNAGFRLPVAGGSDTFSDVWRDPPLGTARTYVWLGGDAPARVGDSEAILRSWLDGLGAGRSFSTNGPLLDFSVNGQPMGSELSLSGGSATVRVQAEANAFVPFRSLDVLVNGAAVRSVSPEAADQRGRWRATLDEEIELTASSWIALRVEGDTHPWVTDTYAFAHSSPVYVVLDGAPILVGEDRAYLASYVSRLIEVAREDFRWNDDDERERALAGFEEALRILSEPPRPR